ncbi:MAG: Ig-like domain-containing protein [Verrucomicrobia bacterium]|nr:Ig-like domain-containing protein [Verrucomicrobiota bacterium]
MKAKLTVLASLVLFAVGIARGAEPSIKSLPPSVIKTVPECGNTNVDAATTTQIKVTFSKGMMDGSWSWSQISDETFPQLIGKPRYLDDKKTCVVDVKLQPKKTYVIWLNTQKFGNFKDTDGTSAVPYLLVFQTK